MEYIKKEDLKDSEIYKTSNGYIFKYLDKNDKI
jgi:hypothetical protein